MIRKGAASAGRETASAGSTLAPSGRESTTGVGIIAPCHARNGGSRSADADEKDRDATTAYAAA
jgi:hypothetical protein